MRKLSLFLAMFLVLAAPALATKGVGIKYNFEHTSFIPAENNCLNYRVYNPWDENVTITLGASEDFAEIFSHSETSFVPAQTSSKNAVPIEICFDVPETSRRKCNSVGYDGQIFAREAETDNAQGPGSAVKIVASAPLKADLVCEDELPGPLLFSGNFVATALQRPFTLGGLLLTLLIMTVLVRQYRKNPEIKRKKYMKLYHEAGNLQNQLRNDPFNKDNQHRFNSVLDKAYKLRKELE